MKNSHLLQFFLFFACVHLFYSAHPRISSANVGVNELIDDIKNKSAVLSSLSCNFTQTKHLSLFQNPIIFTGKLAIIRPDRLRWEFITPVPSVLIFNGDKGIRCSNGEEEVTFSLQSDPVMRMVAEQLWTWLDGDYTELQKNYDIAKAGSSSLAITPLAEETAEIISAVTIVFDDQTRQPVMVTIAEPGGDQTIIEFKDYQLSPVLPDSTFRQCYPRD